MRLSHEITLIGRCPRERRDRHFLCYVERVRGREATRAANEGEKEREARGETRGKEVKTDERDKERRGINGTYGDGGRKRTRR